MLNPQEINLNTSISSKRILVIGGAGYIGSVLVPKLLKQGHFVRVFDWFLFSDEQGFEKHSNLELLRADLRNKEAVLKSLESIDTVIHLAGISNDPSSDLDPELTKEINVASTKYLIDQCVLKKIKRFINASSSSVYGIKEEPDVTEDLSLEPLTVYSESKVAIEEYLKKYRGKIEYVSVRSATVCGYSPRMRLDLTVNILTHHAVKKGKITVFGGTQKRPNIHIEDITDFYIELVSAKKELIDGMAFNVCGENHTVNEIAVMVKDLLGGHIPIDVVPTDDLRSYHISAALAEKQLGFRPKRKIRDAISDVCEALKNKKISDPENEIHYNVKRMKSYLAL